MKTRGLGCDELSRLYAAHELSQAEAAKFEAHLAGCDVCKVRVAEWNELFSLLATPAYDAVHLEPSRDFDKPVMAFVRNLISQRAAGAEAVKAAGAAFTESAAAVDIRAAAARAAAAATARPTAPDLAALRARAVAGATRATVIVPGTEPGAAPEVAALRDRAAALARHAEVARRRAIWVAVASIAAVLFIFSRLLGTFAPSSHGFERPTELIITGIVGVFHKSFDWLVTSFMHGLKIGEIFVLVIEKLRPIFSAFGIAARHLDPQLIVMEVFLFMLTLLLLRGLLGTAPKGRYTNVGIIF